MIPRYLELGCSWSPVKFIIQLVGRLWPLNDKWPRKPLKIRCFSQGKLKLVYSKQVEYLKYTPHLEDSGPYQLSVHAVWLFKSLIVYHTWCWDLGWCMRKKWDFPSKAVNFPWDMHSPKKYLLLCRSHPKWWLSKPKFIL